MYDKLQQLNFQDIAIYHIYFFFKIANYVNFISLYLILTKEEQMIAHEIQKNFLSKTNEVKPISPKELHLINANLLLTDESNFGNYRLSLHDLSRYMKLEQLLINNISKILKN